MTGEQVTILGIETSCDETAAAVLTYDEGKPLTVLSSVVSSQVDLHAVRRRRAGDRQPCARRTAHARHRAGARRSGDRRRPGRCCRGNRRPGPCRLATGWCEHGQDARVGLERSVRRREPSRGASLCVVPRRARAGVARGRAARVRRSHDAHGDEGSRRLPRARVDDRRRRGRGVRQGRPLPRSRLPRRAGDRSTGDGR